ncbi:MAG: 1-deoxy-D-xylulose-5-phosphate reductoisomerase [Actinomycetes bacterium]
MSTTTVSLLGSTGSIGTQTLEVIDRLRGEFEIHALGAGGLSDRLLAQIERYRPTLVVVRDASVASDLSGLLDRSISVLSGPEGLAEAASSASIAVNAVMGFAGLPVTIAALSSGRRLALANKESLIAAAPVVERVRSTPGAEIVPVDSEHCAIHQCLAVVAPERRSSEVRRLLLTASGGPFRETPAEALRDVTIDDALAHPTWSMGPKITIDSSTLMNKGLEVIEAHALFGVGFDAIDVVVHPQSIVHSMVELIDGSTIAQLSNPDMRLPIAYALGFPERLDVAYGALDFSSGVSLEFSSPDTERFPCLGLAYAAGRAGGGAPAWLSASNEVAVDAFLAGIIGWAGIAEIVGASMDRYEPDPLDSLDSVLELDRRARDVTEAIVGARMSG